MDIGTSKARVRDPETASQEGVHSDVRTLSVDYRRAQLRQWLEHAAEIDEAEREAYFKTASQAARSALELAANGAERAELLELWAQLDIAEADARGDTAASAQLHEAARKLEQSLHAGADRASAWESLAGLLVNQASAPSWEDAAAKLGERLGRLSSSDDVAIPRGKVLLELGRLCDPGSRALCLEYAAAAFDRAVMFDPGHAAGWLQAAYAANEAASAATPAVARRLLTGQLERLHRGGEASLPPEITAELQRLRVRAHVQLAQLLDGEARMAQLAAAGRELARVGVEDLRDVHVYEAWVQALLAAASQLEAASARNLLHDATGTLAGSLAPGAPAEHLGRLSTSLGLVWCALAERSAAAEAGALAERAEAAFRSASDHWPALEAAWSSWSELLLRQARLAAPEVGARLRFRVLETLWRGIRAAADPKAACRLAISRGQTLVLLAQHGTAAERDSRYEEARREFEHAAGHDPENWRGWSEASAVLVAQAELLGSSRRRQALERALELLAEGLRAVEAAADPAGVSQLLDRRGLVFAAFGVSRFEDAARQFEFASRAWEQNPAPWLHAAELSCSEGERADPERARELVTRAFDQLSRGLSHASDPVAVSRLLEARARLSLRAAELDVGTERGRKLEEAAADLKRACDEHPSNAAAWRTWAKMWSDRALRASAQEAALELWKQADGVLDAAMQNIPLGEATAELLTDRGAMFVAQAKRVAGGERRQYFERAFACFEEAAQLAPSDGHALQAWGRALAARARYDATAGVAACLQLAADRFRDAAAALPLARRGAAWIEFADELSQLARRDLALADRWIDDAVQQLEAALQEDELHRAAYYLARGALLRDAGRYADAEADFTRGRNAELPAREVVYCQHALSALLEMRGRAGQEWRRTQRAYEVYCAAEPADAEALGHCGVVAYQVFGDYGLAERRLSDAIARRAPNGAQLQMIWSELARERGHTDPAQLPAVAERLREAERFVRRDAIEQPARELWLGTLALWSREYERAEQHLERARALDPWNDAAELALGELLLERGKTELAQRTLEHARQQAPRDLEVRIQLARASERESAERLQREILELSPNHPGALLGLCQLRLEAGDAANERDAYLRAVEYATAAIRCAGTRAVRRVRARELAEAYYARGYAQLKLAALEARSFGVDRAALARSDFRSALRYDRNHLAARDALAKVGPELGILHRHAGTFICALAIGLFIVAQLGFWFAADPRYQLCAGDACLPAFRLRTLDFGGYVALTFGALAFVVVGLALPRRLRQVPTCVDLQVPAFELRAANSVAPR